MNCNVNAKNSYGGYVGAKPYAFTFRNGSLVRVLGWQEFAGSPGTGYMGKLY